MVNGKLHLHRYRQLNSKVHKQCVNIITHYASGSQGLTIENKKLIIPMYNNCARKRKYIEKNKCEIVLKIYKIKFPIQFKRQDQCFTGCVPISFG